MPAPEMTFGPVTRRRWRWLPVGGAAAVVLLAGGVATAAGGSGDPGYRTATAAVRSIDETLRRVGTIEPVTQADVGFPVDGTVASVAVAAGDPVAVGQELARLDTTALETSLVDAQAALDAAELTLEKALAGEDVSGASSTAEGALVVAPAALTVTRDPELTAAQQAVLDAQQAVDTQLALAQQALDDATNICDATTSTSTSTSTTSTAEDPPADVAACRDALQVVLDAQADVDAAQDELVAASTALDTLLDERAAELEAEEDDDGGEQPATNGDSSSPGNPNSSGNSSNSGGGSTTASSSPTSAELIAYQKGVDAAAAEVAVAEQALAQATILSPIAGNVAAVGLEAGAISTDGTIVVVGSGGYEVSTTVTVDTLADLAVGQAATITPDGADEALTGEVVSIDVVGDATTYPVVVGLTEEPEDVRNGATAELSIVTDEAGDALTVPTSAVHVDEGVTTVEVLEDGTPTAVDVQVGAVGQEWTEITEGLEAGTEVVLADLDEPLPGSATDGSSSGTQTGGGFGFGGGFPGGGRPSGGG